MGSAYPPSQARAILEIYGPQKDDGLRATIDQILSEMPISDELAIRMAFGFELDARFEGVEPSKDWRGALAKLTDTAKTLLRQFC